MARRKAGDKRLRIGAVTDVSGKFIARLVESLLARVGK
jgi:hypothetical protein